MGALWKRSTTKPAVVASPASRESSGESAVLGVVFRKRCLEKNQFDTVTELLYRVFFWPVLGFRRQRRKNP